MGGVNYVLNIARMLRRLPEGERPEQVVFLVTTPASVEIADSHRALADFIAPFIDAAKLDLDFVYPATQLSEAPNGAPWAGWIPDWQSHHLPDLFSRAERARRFIQYRALAQGCAVTVLSSEMALRDTRSIVPEGATELRKLRFPSIFEETELLRSEQQLRDTRERLGVPAGYALICNQFWLHKNHRVVFEALRHVRTDVRIVMTGEIGDERWPDYTQQIRDLASDEAIAPRVVVTGRISRSDQIDLMLGAVGFVQPSKFEGWSTFVEEARALGRPILISEFPVHREQAPAGSLFFDPDSPTELASLLDQWFTEAPARSDPAVVRRSHDAFVLECARDFMEIARSARRRFRPGLHDPASIAAASLAQLNLDIQRGFDELTAEDEGLFQAAIRRWFSDYPEELADFCNVISAMDWPLQQRGVDLLVKATLRKMSDAGRHRFALRAEAIGGVAGAVAAEYASGSS